MVASNRGLGKRFDDSVGEVDDRCWHLYLVADASGEVPGVDEEIRGGKGHTFPDRPATHRGVDHLGQVDPPTLRWDSQNSPPAAMTAPAMITGRVPIRDRSWDEIPADTAITVHSGRLARPTLIGE